MGIRTFSKNALISVLLNTLGINNIPSIIYIMGILRNYLGNLYAWRNLGLLKK
jgi:hypothetical protein